MIWGVHADRRAVIAGLFAAALAGALPCEATEAGAVEVDGILEDWRGVRPARPGGGVAVRCLHDDAAFYLCVDGLRGAGTLRLGARALSVSPGAGGPQRAPAGWQLATTRRPGGFALEVRAPADAARGQSVEWRGGGRAFSLSIDTGDEARALEALREQLRVGTRAPDYDRVHSLGFRAGRERLVRFGKFVAVVADEYAFIELPIERAADVLSFEVADYAGEGEAAFVARYVERGSGGERDVLAMYKVVGGEWRRIFAAEVGKRTAAFALSVQVRWLPRKRGLDLSLEALPPRGVSNATFREATATDLFPLLLPWSPLKKVRFRFSGDSYRALDSTR